MKNLTKALGYNNTFRRIEQKYILTPEQKQILLEKISPKIQPDTYPTSEILNLYFDTAQNDLIVHSLDRPVFRQKIRLRSYGVPKDLNSDVFLEIKQKYKKTTGKRRIKITLSEFYDLLNKNQYDKSQQILEEAAYLFRYYDLRPVIFISYDRESYISKDIDPLRITFDKNLKSRTDDLKLEQGNYGEKYFGDQDRYIMEVKSLGAMPLWFTKVLSSQKLYPQSFSKYGHIYTANNLKKKEEKC